MNEKKSTANSTHTTTANKKDRLLGPNLSFSATEAYKLLRANLSFGLPDNGECKIIGITSSFRGEGKSTTSINLAYTMAQTGKKVLLLEADLRLPTFAKRLNLHPTPGLSNFLAYQCKGSDIIQATLLSDDLMAITAGSIPPNPAELLESEEMKKTMEILAKAYDVIIVDLPPVSMVSDALFISKHLNGMIVVCRTNYCEKKELEGIISKLRFAECKILGIVMTGADTQSKRYGKYGK